MSPCKYYAPNGKPSIMFNSLFEHYKTQYEGDEEQAEKAAVKVFLRTRTKAFKDWFGDWENVKVNSNSKTQVAQIRKDKKIITQYSDETFDIKNDEEAIADFEKTAKKKYEDMMSSIPQFIKDVKLGKATFHVHTNDPMFGMINNANHRQPTDYDKVLQSFVMEVYNGDEQFASGEVTWDPKDYDRVKMSNGIEIGMNRTTEEHVIELLEQGAKRELDDAIGYSRLWDSKEGADRYKGDLQYQYDISEYGGDSFALPKGLIKSSKGYTLRSLGGGSLGSIPGSQGAIKGYAYYHSRTDRNKPDAHMFIDRIDSTGVYIRYTHVVKDLRGKGISTIMLNRVRKDYPNLPIHRTLITNPIIVKQSSHVQGVTDSNGNPLPKFKDDQEIHDWLETNDEIILPPLENSSIASSDTSNVSKIVDANGEPLVVYHGTNEQFTIFNKNASRKRFGDGSAKQGMFFTTQYEGPHSSEEYGDISMPVFLNIKNPEYQPSFNPKIEEPQDKVKSIREGIRVDPSSDGIIESRNYIKEKGQYKVEPDIIYNPEYPTQSTFAVVYEPNQIKSVDNIGYFDSEKDDIMAMIDDRASYTGETSMDNFGNDDDLFYMYAGNREALESGKKIISIRPKEYETGVYKLGDSYYRVTTRGWKMLSDLKESPEALRTKFIGDAAVKYSHIQQFLGGHVGMYVYDIKKIEPKDEQHAMIDFVGNMRLGKVDPEANLNVGNDTFGSFITAINDYITRLEDERRRFKGNRVKIQEYTTRIEQQKKLLKTLQTTKTIRALVEIGETQIAQITKFALKEGASLLEQTEGMRITNAWKEITKIMDLTREGKSESDLLLVNRGRDLEHASHDLYNSLWNRSKEDIVRIAKSKGIDLSKVIVDDEFIFNDVEYFGTQSLSSGWSSNAIEQLMTALKDENNSTINAEHYAYLKEGDDKKSTLLGSKNASTKFLAERFTIGSLTEDGKPIKIEREGIITKYDRKFDSEHLNMKYKADLGTITWKEYYAFERKHYDYHLTDEGKEAWKKHADDIRASHISSWNGEEPVFDEEAEAAIKRDLDKYDPYIFGEFLKDNNKPANSGGAWYNKVPKDNIPLNPAYARLTENQKEYHKWFTTTFAEHNQNTKFDYRFGETDIDHMIMSFTKDVDTVSKAKYVGDAALEWMKNLFAVTATSTKGKVITRALTGEEHIKGQFKSIAEFVSEGHGEIDPSHILNNFVSMSISFKNKRNIEEIMNYINDVAKIAKRRLTNNSGIGKDDRAGAPISTNKQTNVSNRVEYTIKETLTGSGKDPNKTLNKGVAPGEKGFSIEQSLDTMNALTRTRYMALAPLGAAGNLFMGLLNNAIYAAGGRYFTDKQLAKAMWMLKASPVKFISEGLTNGKMSVASPQSHLIAEIMYAYNIIGDVTEKLVHKESAINKIYALQKGGEFIVQGGSTLAQMFNTPVTFKDGTKGKNLFDIYKLNKDGRIEIQKDLLADDDKFQDDQEIYRFFEKAKTVNEKIHGDYNNPLLAKKTVTGRVLFMFRTWLPMSIKERFGAQYEHRILGTQKGRYVSALDLAKSIVYQKGKDDEKGRWEFSAQGAGDFVKIFLKMIPGLNHKINLSDRVSDIDRENINMFVREMQVLLMTYGAMCLAKANTGDDDDKDKDFWTYAYNQSERLNSELSFYFVPTSYNQIFQSLVPLTSTLIDGERTIGAIIGRITNPEKDIYERGFRKGDSKALTAVERFLPLTRSAQTVWSSLSQMHNSTYSK